MKTVEKSGKTIDIAVEAALSQLGVAREETTIEVLEQPTKGIFGFGAKNALVRVTVIGDDSVADTPGETSTKETAPKAATAGSPDTDPVATAMEFLQNIFEKFELTIDIQVTPGEEFTTLDLVGEDLGILIGRRGETLDALQYLTNLTVSRKYKERHKFILDAEDYRAKRRETLERLAKKLADKVLATNRSVSLEPMSPYERRIIHTVLQDYPGVRTFSEGEEPYRKVVITKKR